MPATTAPTGTWSPSRHTSMPARLEHADPLLRHPQGSPGSSPARLQQADHGGVRLTSAGQFRPSLDIAVVQSLRWPAGRQRGRPRRRRPPCAASSLPDLSALGIGHDALDHVASTVRRSSACRGPANTTSARSAWSYKCPHAAAAPRLPAATAARRSSGESPT